jgi:signal transduction histidine kinase
MKLFSKTIRTYLLYSFAIFMVTIPIFYFVVRTVLLHSVDKSLKTQLREIRSNLDEIHSPIDLATWSKLDKDILLAPASDTMPDKVYTIYRFSPKHHEKEPFREVEGRMSVNGRMYSLIISSSLVENEDLLGSILLVQAVMLIMLMGGMLWINQKTSKRLWQPFYAALRNMQQFELNKQTELPFKESTTDEFNELNKAIRNLFRRSYDVYLQQKEFTENASHEMQTPLAIFQNKLELLMQTSPLSEDQAQLINDLDATNRRLIRLNKSLLLLTKIENNQYQPVEEVNIRALCEKLIRQYQLYNGGKNLTLQEQYAEALLLLVNPTLIEVLVSNLLSNAFRYTPQNGTIRVTVEKDKLTIQNSGFSAPLDPYRIFDRFQKQNNSQGFEDGTGLGLAIVKNICALYKYTISYSYRENLHTFRVTFTN